jgi:hypothetical protein
MKRRKRIPATKLAIIGFALLVIGIQSVYGFSTNQETLLCSDEIKVMPLGDSITTGKYSGSDTSDPQGAEDDIGYRKDLWDFLIAGGFNVDFVGTQSNGNVPSSPFVDPEHEGHNGYTDSNIAYNIYNNGGENWLNQNPPDIILMHIGTNHLDNNPSAVESILNEIDEYESDSGRRVIMIRARIINMVGGNAVVTHFNDNVEAMAKNRPEYGVDLFMVDMEDGAGLIYSYQPAGDMWDGLHPYATGYIKMAAVWFTAFSDLCNEVYLPLVLEY